MNTYKDLYYYLFNQITTLSQELEKIQQTAEEMYISSEDNSSSKQEGD